MQAINRLLSQNCNCYPHLFRCSTIKIHNSFQLPLKPSVALLSSHFNTLFSFQGAISSFFEARSQNPISWVLRSNGKLELVGPSGLEPPTLRLSVVRSSQLSYGPLFFLVEIVGIEPATSCLQGRRSPSWAISPSYLRLAGFAYTL